MTEKTGFSCVSFNCFGFKSSSAYVEKLCNEYDVCFLCEHWLRPHELSALTCSLSKNKLWSVLKSSMDPEVIQRGRSYGGVGFICKEKKGVSYRSLDVESDRICALQVVSSQSTIFTVIGVYMPYNNGTSEHTELYVETIEKLQDLIDTYANNSPIMIVGDFNACLPQQEQLSTFWYRTRPFTRQSLLLYDFFM